MTLISNTGQASYESDVEAVFEALQQQRSSLLSLARDMQLAARLLALEEARRLTRDVGADDARVSRLLDDSAVMLNRAAALEVEAQIADIRVPPITKTETLLQGRVTDESAMATAHVTVTLIDDKGVPVPGIDPVETDDSGYYAFVLQPAQLDAIGASTKLNLQIGTDSGKLVPTTAVPFRLTTGKVTVSEARLQPTELEKLGVLMASTMRNGESWTAAEPAVAANAVDKAKLPPEEDMPKGRP